MLIAAALVVLALAILFGVIKMSAALDALTASVTALEATATTVATEIADLKAGATDAALPAVTSRVDAVITSLGGTPPAPAV